MNKEELVKQAKELKNKVEGNKLKVKNVNIEELREEYNSLVEQGLIDIEFEPFDPSEPIEPSDTVKS